MTEEDRIHKAGEIILSLLTALPPTSASSMDWPAVAELARHLLSLAEPPE